MKSSHVAVAGGVFAAVLIACFALVGFGSKGEATAKPDPDSIPAPPEPAPAPTPSPIPTPPQPLAPPKPLGGYDGSAALNRATDSAQSVLFTWALPAADVKDFGDHYHTVRLVGERFVAASDHGVRVLNARTGEPTGAGEGKATAGTVISPNGDWAIQVTPTVSVVDLATGQATTVTATGKRVFTGPAAFGAANDCGAVLGTDDGKPAAFRVRKDGTVELLGAFRADTGRGDASRIAQLFASTDGGRFVVNRPAERSPAKRFLSWVPGEKGLTPLPAFDAEMHDAVLGFRLSADGTRAAMFNDKSLKVFDLTENRLLLTHEPEKLKIGDAAFAPNGRLVVTYASQAKSGDPEAGEPETTTLPGHAWVLDVNGKTAIGLKFHFADAAIGAKFRRLVLSADGSRLAVVEKSGKVHIADAHRAFGGALVGSSATPSGPTGPTAPKPDGPTSGAPS